MENTSSRNRITSEAYSVVQTENNYQQLFERLIDVYFRTDASGILTLVSPSLQLVVGLSPQDVIGTSVADHYANPNEQVQLLEHLRQVGELYNQEVLLRKKDGTLIWVSFNARALKDSDGRFDGIEGIFRDVSANKKAEVLMRIQRDLGTALSNTSSLDAALSICLDAALQVPGIEAGGIYLLDNITGQLDLMVYCGLPDNFADSVAHLDKTSPQAQIVNEKKSVFKIFAEVTKDFGLSRKQRRINDACGFRAMGVVPVSHEGKAIGCLNVVSKTEDEISTFGQFCLETMVSQMAAALVRIRSDQALKENQHNLNTLFESLDDFLFVLNNNSQIIGFNPVVEKRLGYSAKELKGMPVTEVHPPEQRQEAIEIIQLMLAGRLDYCPIPLKTRDGQLIPVETRVTMGVWNGQQALFGISRDITKRLAAEEAQRISEARLMAAIDAIDEGFVIYDSQDRLAMCNAKYMEIYKASADLIRVGTSFESIVREGAKRGQYADAIDDIEAWVKERLRRHQLCDEKLEQQLSDGRWLRISERKMEDGSTVGFRVDITDIKRNEKLINKALQEKEVLLKEIHHRVKNNLAVVVSLLNFQSKRNKDYNVQRSLIDSQLRVRAMALIHETLYQTNDLSIVPFNDYIHRLIRDLLMIYKPAKDRIDIEYDINELNIDIGQAVPCGLIINELVTNALKHAFPGERTGFIKISANKTDGGPIELRIKDNGIGFFEKTAGKSAETLGLHLVSLMIEQLNGAWEINTDHGVDIVIQWPPDVSERE